MSVLAYDIKVIGASLVNRELAGIERTFARHNAKMMRTLGPAATRGGAAKVPGAAKISSEQRNITREWERLQLQVQRTTDRRKELGHKQELRRIGDEHRARLRAERDVARAAERESRQRTQTEARAANERARAEIKARQTAARQQGRAHGEFKSGIRGALGNVGQSIAGVGRGVVGALGIAGGGTVAAQMYAATQMDRDVRGLVVNARGSGEAGFDPKQIQEQVRNTSIASGIGQQDLIEGLKAAVAKTGDLGKALAQMSDAATVAQATGGSVADVFTLMADTSKKFGVEGEAAMRDVLATLVGQGKRGAFEMKDLSGQAGRLFAGASAFGLSNASDVKSLGGLTQIARDVTGSPEQAAFAVEAMFRQLTAKSAEMQSGEAFGGRKVQIFKDNDPTKGARNFTDILPDLMAASRGNVVQLQDVFGQEGIRAINPLISEYRNASQAAGGGAKGADAGKAAVRAKLSAASDVPANFGDIQRDAADNMLSVNAQLQILNTQLSAAVQRDLLPAFAKLIPQVTKLIPLFSAGVEKLSAFVSWFADNPIAGLGALVLGKVAVDLAAAGIGAAVSSVLTSLIAAAGAKAMVATGASTVGGAAVAGTVGLAGKGLAVAGGAIAAKTGLAAAGVTAGLAGAGATLGVGAAGYQLYEMSKESGGFGNAIKDLFTLGGSSDERRDQSARADFAKREGLSTTDSDKLFSSGFTGENFSALLTELKTGNKSSAEAARSAAEAAQAAKEAATASALPNRGTSPSKP